MHLSSLGIDLKSRQAVMTTVRHIREPAIRSDFDICRRVVLVETVRQRGEMVGDGCEGALIGIESVNTDFAARFHAHIAKVFRRMKPQVPRLVFCVSV